VNHRDNRTAQQRPDADNGTDTATDSTDSFRVAPTLFAQRALILGELPLEMPREASRAAVIQIIFRLVATRISIRARSKSVKSVAVSVQLSVGPRCSAVSAAQTARPCSE